MKRGRGRPSIIEKRQSLTIDKILRAYSATGSVAKASEVLGVSDKTVRNYIHKYDPTILRKPGGIFIEDANKPLKHHSSFARWLRENPNVELPLSTKEIAELTGCTYNAVACYIYRRRSVVRKIIKSITDLKILGSEFKTVKNHTINIEDIETFRLEHIPKTLNAYIHITLRYDPVKTIHKCLYRNIDRCFSDKQVRKLIRFKTTLSAVQEHRLN